MKPYNVFADHMGGGWPIMGEWPLLIGEPSGSEIICERIHPHIHYMFGVARHGNAPIKCGAADGKITKSACNEGGNFIAILFRHNEVWVLGVKVKQGLGIG